MARGTSSTTTSTAARGRRCVHGTTRRGHEGSEARRHGGTRSPCAVSRAAPMTAGVAAIQVKRAPPLLPVEDSTVRIPHELP